MGRGFDGGGLMDGGSQLTSQKSSRSRKGDPRSEFTGVDLAGSSEFVFRHRTPYTLQECNVLFRVVVRTRFWFNNPASTGCEQLSIDVGDSETVSIVPLNLFDFFGTQWVGKNSSSKNLFTAPPIASPSLMKVDNSFAKQDTSILECKSDNQKEI
nr:hypothetical protein Iba_chr12eCG6330 [Ipomoea batatas]